MHNLRLLVFAIIVVVAGVILSRSHLATPTPTPSPSPTASASSTTSPSPTSSPATTATAARFVDPIAEFKTRITKKRFGTYVTPQNSPVQPERFTGYHTGVDVEYTDTAADIPVFAMADGIVRQAQFVSGYGGLLVIEHPAEHFSSLYGHMRMSSLPAVGSTVTKGQRVGVLGTGNSPETDGERHHLHFAIVTNSPADVRGYVPAHSDLATHWLDPLSLYP